MDLPGPGAPELAGGVCRESPGSLGLGPGGFISVRAWCAGKPVGAMGIARRRCERRWKSGSGVQDASFWEVGQLG